MLFSYYYYFTKNIAKKLIVYGGVLTFFTLVDIMLCDIFQIINLWLGLLLTIIFMDRFNSDFDNLMNACE